jgi:glycosyltransferase involved in cell wall biosynthesis
MSRRLHIAYVCADRGIPVGGQKGGSAHIGELTRALKYRGAEVRILAARANDEVDESALPAPTTDLGAQRAVRQMRQALYAEVRGAKAQVAAGEAFGLMLNPALGKALERLHKDWRIDAVYERYSLWSHSAADFARSNELPYLLEVNAPLVDEQRRYRGLVNAAAAASIEGYVFRAADRVLVPSAELEPYVMSKGAGAVSVVPNAADPERFRPEGGRVRARKDGPFVVGFAGSLKPWHGIEYLVRAFKRLRRISEDYRLLIVGDGPLRTQLEGEIRRNGWRDAATLTGAVEIDEVARLLTQMDAATAPYPPLRGFYFSPLKVFEYMAAGVPIVASDIGQIGEILTHRRTALLHRAGAVDEIAARIDELRRKPVLAAGLAREARALLCRRYTWRRNADRVLSSIASARRKKRRGPH